MFYQLFFFPSPVNLTKTPHRLVAILTLFVAFVYGITLAGCAEGDRAAKLSEVANAYDEHFNAYSLNNWPELQPEL